MARWNNTNLCRNYNKKEWLTENQPYYQQNDSDWENQDKIIGEEENGKPTNNLPNN